METTTSDRRQSRRMPAQAASFVVFDNHQTMIGRILDISREGICCQLAGDTPPASRWVTLVSYGLGDPLTLANVPLADIAYQQFCPLDDGNCWLRLGARFGDLNREQRNTIRLFYDLRRPVADSLAP